MNKQHMVSVRLNDNDMRNIEYLRSDEEGAWFGLQGATVAGSKELRRQRDVTIKGMGGPASQGVIVSHALDALVEIAKGRFVAVPPGFTRERTDERSTIVKSTKGNHRLATTVAEGGFVDLAFECELDDVQEWPLRLFVNGEFDITLAYLNMHVGIERTVEAHAVVSDMTDNIMHARVVDPTTTYESIPGVKSRDDVLRWITESTETRLALATHLPSPLKLANTIHNKPDGAELVMFELSPCRRALAMVTHMKNSPALACLSSTAPAFYSVRVGETADEPVIVKLAYPVIRSWALVSKIVAQNKQDVHVQALATAKARAIVCCDGVPLTFREEIDFRECEDVMVREARSENERIRYCQARA